VEASTTIAARLGLAHRWDPRQVLPAVALLGSRIRLAPILDWCLSLRRACSWNSMPYAHRRCAPWDTQLGHDGQKVGP